uniref:Uncharacterized protein n=1 Tax=Vespula pensylvanica TaxID=30213 RepID=A0A834JL08_VESPE|nr:hypothetical protein H0235_017665 [Vespula pensylvanica]
MSSKDLINTTNEFYDLNERLLMLTGLWPYQEKFEKFLRTCIVNVSLLLALLFETKKPFDHVIFDCNHLSNKEEIIIMRKYAKENERFTVCIAPTCDTYNWIKDIVNHQVNVTHEFIDLLNLLCEQIYLIQMILGTLCFATDCIYILQISYLIKNINEAILCIIYIGGSVITIYLNRYIGQRLLDHSATLLENFQLLIGFPRNMMDPRNGVREDIDESDISKVDGTSPERESYVIGANSRNKRDNLLYDFRGIKRNEGDICRRRII